LEVFFVFLFYFCQKLFTDPLEKALRGKIHIKILFFFLHWLIELKWLWLHARENRQSPIYKVLLNPYNSDVVVKAIMISEFNNKLQIKWTTENTTLTDLLRNLIEELETTSEPLAHIHDRGEGLVSCKILFPIQLYIYWK
jgi:hypothetical protein